MIDLDEACTRIELLCKRPGMFLGDESLERIVIFFSGMLYALSISGPVSIQTWRDWIHGKHPKNKGQAWEKVLVDAFGSEQAVIQRLPAEFREFVATLRAPPHKPPQPR